MGDETKTHKQAERSTSEGARPRTSSPPGSPPVGFGVSSFESAAGNMAMQRAAGAGGGPVSTLLEWSFDPYAENVVDLTNRDLIDAILFTDDWLAGNGIVHLDYDAYEIRQKRLETERQARIVKGHLWLKTVPERVSEQLYQTISGANGAFDVVSVENDELVYGPAGDISDRPIMTKAQFGGSLTGQDVPTMSLADYRAQVAASQPQAGADAQLPEFPYSFADSGSQIYGLSGAVSQSNIRSNLLQDAFALTNPMARQGALGEVYFGTSAPGGHGFGAADYNAIPWFRTDPRTGQQVREIGNHPVVDYRTYFGARPEMSVKTSSIVNADPFRRYSTYTTGYAEMMNTSPGYRGFDHYMNNAARGRTAATVRNQLSLVINADDVAGFRQFILDPFARGTTPQGRPSRQQNYQRSGLMRIYDGILQDRPLILPDGTSLSTIAALDVALQNNTITAAQHQAAVNGAAQQAAAKVVPNPEFTNAVQSRYAAARGRVPGAMSALDVRSALTPEYMKSLEHGGGWRGDLHAMRSYGGRGAFVGALSGMATEGWNMATDDQANPDAFERLARAGGREGLRGGATSALETYAASQGSRYVLQQGLARGSSRALATRVGARFVPGGVVDVGFEGYDMLTDERENSGREVGYRVARAFVIGGTSALAGATAGAYAGAAVGTAIFPGVGTVVGFVVGVIVGAIVGFILSSLIPNYEEMVMEQVPLKEFEKNIQSQTPASIQNQALADQEYLLLQQLVHGPQDRGPHNMFDMYRRRNYSNSPGFRMYAEAMIGDQIHGGCQDCHTQKGISDYDRQFRSDSEAWLAPVDRMYLAAQEEQAFGGRRGKFLDWDIPGQTVDPKIAARMIDDPAAVVIMNSINTIQPNFAEWREILGSKGGGIIPPHVMNSPLDETELYNKIQGNIDRKQFWFELFFNEVGGDEYKLYRDNLRKAQEAEAKKTK